MKGKHAFTCVSVKNRKLISMFQTNQLLYLIHCHALSQIKTKSLSKYNIFSYRGIFMLVQVCIYVEKWCEKSLILHMESPCVMVYIACVNPTKWLSCDNIFSIWNTNIFGNVVSGGYADRVYRENHQFSMSQFPKKSLDNNNKYSIHWWRRRIN